VIALIGAPGVAAAQDASFDSFPEVAPFEEQFFPSDWWREFGEVGPWLDWSQPAPPTPESTGDPASAPRRLLTPFPVVRLAGLITRSGTRIVRLTVEAPRDSRVAVRCRGTSCPFRRSTRTSTGGTIRIRRLERSLRPGTVIEVLVGRAGRIGKYTRFVIRDARGPKRTDLCLWPGASTGQPCPTD
jgi:hypothetical protein